MPLSWGMPYFISVGSNLIFGSTSATNNVTFTNPINLNGATQSLLDTANPTNTDWVIFTGVISNGALNIGDPTHTGTVVLAANNTYTGPTHVMEGTPILTGSIQSTAVTIDAGSTLNDETTTGGFLNDPTVTNNGTLDLAGNETVLSLTNTGTINGPGRSLPAPITSTMDRLSMPILALERSSRWEPLIFSAPALPPRS